MTVFEEIARAVLDGDEVAAPKLCSAALAGGAAARDVLQQGLLAGMTEVGRLFRDGEYFVPEVLVAAEALKAAMAELAPHLAAAGVRPDAAAVIGTVQGDLHDIGKNLVATMFAGAGFEVVDLGVDVPPERFVAVCRDHRARVVGLSALLTTTMPMLATTVQRLRAELQPAPLVLVGGAPVTAEYATKIGADGYGRDAASGAELARRLLRG